MTMKPSTLGLLAFGYNAGILVFNNGFTTVDKLAAPDPVFFGFPTQLMILVFGGCYLASGLDNTKWGRRGGNIWLMYAVEKMVFVAR
jgi:hypothetical protein